VLLQRRQRHHFKEDRRIRDWVPAQRVIARGGGLSNVGTTFPGEARESVLSVIGVPAISDSSSVEEEIRNLDLPSGCRTARADGEEGGACDGPWK